MTQGILVVLLFTIALFFLGRKLYREFAGKGEHCGGCVVNELRDQQRSNLNK